MTATKISNYMILRVPIKFLPGGVLNFELGTDVGPEVSTTTL